MLGTPDLVAILGTGLDNRNHDAVRSFIREACKAGLAVMLCLPGTKHPADMRTIRTRNAADKEAQEAAKAAGRKDWAKIKSPSGLALASTDHTTVTKYLDEYIRSYSTWVDGAGNRVTPKAKDIKEGTVTMTEPVPVNVAIEVGASRLVVVDCDTHEQKWRFLNWLAGGQDLPPTVVSPGQMDQSTGEWLHSNGGHYYFSVPENVELPTNLGALTMSGDDGFAILWNRRYVLVPPSTRPEGAYRLVGSIYPLPQPLKDEIDKAGSARQMRVEQYAQRQHGDGLIAAPGDDFVSAIDAWADRTPWEEILEPIGWTPAARTDNCGCETWTAGPGHASPKSATAHDKGCGLGRYTEVNTPLHIWTDNPGEPFNTWVREHGSQTMSKLQVVALTQHNDDMGKAMEALGLKPVEEIAKTQQLDQNAIGNQAGVSADNLNAPLWGQSAPTPAADWPPAPQPPAEAPAAPVVESPFAQLAQTDQGQTVLDRMTTEQRAAAEAHLAAVEQKNAAPPFDNGGVLPPAAPHDMAMTQQPVVGMTDEQRAAVEAARAKKEDAEDAALLAESGVLDEFGTHQAILTVTCDCGMTKPKTYVRNSPEFKSDADGDWWHAEIDDTGATTGSHMMFPEPPLYEESTVHLDGKLIGTETVPVPAVPAHEITVTGSPTPPPPPWSEGVPFAAPGDSPLPPPTPQFLDVADDPDPTMLSSTVFGVPVIAPFSHWRDMPPPEYIIDGLIENGGLSCIIGPPGVGKSSVSLDMACHIATGKRWQGRRTLKTKVLYMPGEGLSGAVQRIAAWEEAHGIAVGDQLLLADSILKLAASNEAWQEVGNYIIQQGIGFIIFDTFARMALLVEENSATEVGKAVERFDQVRRHTNAGVLIVHHTGKHSEMARGSSALNGALDSELLIRNGHWDTTQVLNSNGQLPGKPIELDTTKQKNSEQLDEPIPLMMVNWEARNAPIITGPAGKVDPMQSEIVLARPVPEPLIETAIRMHTLIATSFPEQGATRTELFNYLSMDAHTAGRPDAAKAWKRKIAEAVDVGLRLDLIETLTGTAAGGRYIRGAGTADDARIAYARSIIVSDPNPGQTD